jgi:hypothetical protein
MTSMVSLLPATKPNLSQSDRLQIVAADLTDAYGRPLDGNDDGQPGGNFSVIFTKQGVAFEPPNIRLDGADNRPVPDGWKAANVEIIDALIARGGLAEQRRSRTPSARDVASRK